MDGTTTRILVEQTLATNIEALGQFAGRLDTDELAALDEALKLVFALW